MLTLGETQSSERWPPRTRERLGLYLRGLTREIITPARSWVRLVAAQEQVQVASRSARNEQQRVEEALPKHSSESGVHQLQANPRKPLRLSE